MPQEPSSDGARVVRDHLSISSGRGRGSRTLDERVLVRFPGLAHRLANRLMRLPPGSQLRRALLRRIAEQASAAVNRRDFDVMMLVVDPAFEYRTMRDPAPPGMDAVFHGHDGFKKAWEQMIDYFQDLRMQPEELLDLGDALVATVLVVGRGRGSGAPATFRVHQLYTLRGGLLVSQHDFGDRAHALKAAGLAE